MPLEETTSFHDAIFGDITVDNEELDDMILISQMAIPPIILQTLLTTIL